MRTTRGEQVCQRTSWRGRERDTRGENVLREEGNTYEIVLNHLKVVSVVPGSGNSMFGYRSTFIDCLGHDGMTLSPHFSSVRPLKRRR